LPVDLQTSRDLLLVAFNRQSRNEGKGAIGPKLSRNAFPPLPEWEWDDRAWKRNPINGTKHIGRLAGYLVFIAFVCIRLGGVPTRPPALNTMRVAVCPACVRNLLRRPGIKKRAPHC